MDVIHWIHHREEYRANQIAVENVRQLPNVEIWAPFVVVEWAGAMEDNTPPLEMEGTRITGARNGQADADATSSFVLICNFMQWGFSNDWINPYLQMVGCIGVRN